MTIDSSMEIENPDKLKLKPYKMKMDQDAFYDLKKIAIDEKVGIGRLMGIILENFVFDYQQNQE